jgi:hypothetical protein
MVNRNAVPMDSTIRNAVPHSKPHVTPAPAGSGSGSEPRNFAYGLRATTPAMHWDAGLGCLSTGPSGHHW